MIKRYTNSFWGWYEKTLSANTIIVAILFTWQLIHLYWLTTNVVATRLLSVSYFNPSPFLEALIVIADYGEIPAIFAATLLYIRELRLKFNYKSIWMLVFINSQWLHILWITDEFVVQQFSNTAVLDLPIWLAWLAIGIDYLELPVIYDALKKAFRLLTTD